MCARSTSGEEKTPPHPRTLMITASSHSEKEPFLTAGLRWFHQLFGRRAMWGERGEAISVCRGVGSSHLSSAPSLPSLRPAPAPRTAGGSSCPSAP